MLNISPLPAGSHQLHFSQVGQQSLHVLSHWLCRVHSGHSVDIKDEELIAVYSHCFTKSHAVCLVLFPGTSMPPVLIDGNDKKWRLEKHGITQVHSFYRILSKISDSEK